MENPLIAAETVRKASLSNLHTHEATGSSPVVSTKNHRNCLIPVIFSYNLQLFMALNFCCFFKTHTLTHTGKGAESTGQGQTENFLSGPVFLPHLPHLLADDPTDGIGSVLLHLRRGMGVGVQGEASRVVAQRAGQRFHIHAAFQGQRGEGVAEIMKPDMLRADGFQNFIMRPAESVRVIHGSGLGRWEHIWVAPTKQEGEKTNGQLHQTDVDAIKKDVVTRTNTLRLNKGVAVLKVNNLLMDAAQVRADEMAASGAYSHTRPDGRRSNTVTDSRRTGENIHCITELYLEQQHKTLSDAVVNLWSNSKGHADNMLNARYGEIGVGLARGTDSNGLACWYCVQVFLVDGCEVTWVDVPAIG